MHCVRRSPSNLRSMTLINPVFTHNSIFLVVKAAYGFRRVWRICRRATWLGSVQFLETRHLEGGWQVETRLFAAWKQDASNPKRSLIRTVKKHVVKQLFWIAERVELKWKLPSQRGGAKFGRVEHFYRTIVYNRFFGEGNGRIFLHRLSSFSLSPFYHSPLDR